MNRIYKSVWNAVTRSWTAVSEAQKNRGKSTKSFSKLFLSTIALSAIFSNALADTYYGGEDVPIGNIIWGSNDLIYDDGRRTTFRGGGEHSLVFSVQDSEIANFEDGVLGLINLTSNFYHQTVLTTGDLNFGPIDGGEHINIHVDGDSEGLLNAGIQQKLTNSTGTVATLNFVIGDQAYGLAKNNATAFGVIQGDDSIQFEGTNYSFSTEGIAWSEGDNGWIKTLALLTGVDIQANQTLSLSGIETGSSEALWSAVVSGAGGIEYEGNGTVTIGTVIEKWVDGSDYDDSNTYTGSTTVKGLTLNLNKNKSLGNTSLLSIGSGATVNVGTDSEDVGQLDLSDGTLNLGYRTFNVGDAGAVISSDGQLKGGTASLSVGGDLTVKSENSAYQNSKVSASNITVSSADAFGTNTESTAVYNYVFDGAEGTQVNTIKANQIVLQKNTEGEASHVTYGSNATITTNSTLISDGSSLSVVGTGQLGKKVLLNKGVDSLDKFNKLIIENNSSDVNWGFGTGVAFESNDEYAVIVAKGSENDVDGTTFTIPEAERTNWSGYKGWLRISDTNFNLDTTLDDSIFNDNHVGLSVGSGGTVFVTDRVVNIDRFGWSNEENNNGVLDLTQVQPSGTNSTDPILTVGELRMEGSGSIKIDASHFVTSDSALTGDSVLDYQSGAEDNRFWVIKAENVTGSAKSSVKLDDHAASSSKTTTTDLSNSNGQLAAKAMWGYSAELVTEGTTEKGVYLTYALNQLELVGNNATNAALELKLADADERNLRVKVTGAGIIEIDGANTDNKSVTISNVDNDFVGLVDVKDNVELTAISGAIGNKGGDKGEVALRLANGASFILEADQGSPNSVQTLNAVDVADSSKIVLNSALDLDLKDSSYLGSTTKEISATQLSGSGALSLRNGTFGFENVTDTFFTNYTGVLTADAGTTMNFTSDEGYTLKNISGEGTVGLFVNNDNTVVALGDVNSFTGTIEANGSAELLLDQGTVLSNSVTLSAKDKNTLTFNEFGSNTPDSVIDENLILDGFENYNFENTIGIFQKTGALNLNLTSSNIVRNDRADLDASASIAEGSELTYDLNDSANGTISLASITGEGTLGLEFAKETDLAITDKGSFAGQLRIENAKFEVGAKHTGDQNAEFVESNALFVDSGSTLITNGQQTFGAELTLGSGSALDFTTDSDSFVVSGLSANAINMDGNNIVLAGSDNVLVSVKVDTSIQIKEADTSGTLMEAVRDTNDSGLSLILIDKIKDDASDLANHMQLNDSDKMQTAVVTYHDTNSTAIADITTGVGLDGVGHQIGLTYDEVTEVAIYDGQTAVLEATGEGDVISAKLTNKDQGTGSVQYTGNGLITLTNSSNDYTGKTIVDGSAQVVADAANTLGHSERVVVGGNSAGQLTINGNQEKLGGIEVRDNGTVTFGKSSVVTVTDSTDSVIEGNLEGEGTFALVNSNLTYKTDVQKTLSVAFDTDADSTFVKTGAGVLDFERKLSNFNMNVAEGGVVFDDGDSLSNLSLTAGTTVDVNGLVNIANLSGSGIFNMPIAFGEGSRSELTQGQPGLHIAFGTGSHFLNVQPKDLNKGAEESIKVVQIDSGDATFALYGGKEAITSGGYDYQFVKQEDGSGTSYSLDSKSGPENVRNTTVTAGSYIGIAYAAQLFDVSLHDRVGNRDWINPVTGEKQSTSLWMRHSMSHERFRDSTSQLRMRSTSNVTMLGGDLVQYTTEGDSFAYAGLMGGYGTMDTKSRSKMTNLRSKSETDAWGVGAYAGWKANKDGQTGPYVDGWLMFTHASSDVTGVDRQEENIKGEGLSASIEAGWGFKLGSVETANGKYATFTVEPHASVTWFGMEYDDLHTDAQDVKFEGKNNVRTRLGTRVNMTEEGNKTFNAFAEANWVHNTQEYGATISGLTVDQTGSRNQAEGRIGVDWRITKDLSAWARVGASFGSDNYSEREGSIGVRYQF